MHHKGPALVLAGPGSGKTTVLVERVRNLIEMHNVSPDKILVVTFAKAAAVQMQERFLNLTRGKYGSVTFSTIHSVCYSIINSEGSFGNYSLLPENEKTDLISRSIKDFFIQHPEKIKVPGLLKDVLKEMTSFDNCKVPVEKYRTRFCDQQLFEYCCKHLKDFK